jgi:hypothetical protein
MQRWKRMSTCLWMLALCVSCSDSTSPDRVPPPLAASEIDRLVVFVRDWPDRYVEVDFRRQAGGSTLVVFRPSQPGVPRVLLDSIGPSAEDPAEIVELLDTYNVWALADSNAAGAACSTRTGQWVCNITVEDYSLVMLVQSGGTQRAQRYTALEERTDHVARKLGDYVFAMMQRRQDRASAARGR